MSKILELYNNSSKKIFANVGRTLEQSIIDRKLPPIDEEFDRTTMVQRYNNSIYSSVSSINSNQSILQTYYKTYGYNALIGDAVGYLTGLKDATSLLQSGLSLFVPGVTRGTVGSVILGLTNQALRNPFIENTINNFLPSPINLIPEGQIRWQTLPSELFLQSTPPPDYVANSNPEDVVGNIIKNAGISLFASTLSGLSTSGTLTSFDWQRAFGKGLDTAETIMLAKAGIKYTKAVAWFDTTRPIWSDRPGYYTYDKYIAYSNGDINYSNSKEKYKDTILDRYYESINPSPSKSLKDIANKNGGSTTNPAVPNNFIPKANSPISNGLLNNNVNNIKAYKASLGNNIDPVAEPEKKYSNSGISNNGEKISDIINRLGFPQFSREESSKYGISDAYYDKINRLDLNDPNEKNVKDIITFKFEDISSESEPVSIRFRSTLTGISDSISPEWNATKYLGRPDKFYTYDSVDRSISFSFKVYSYSKNEVPYQWRKINRLAGLCYPVSYSGNRVMKSPIIRLTIGNLYERIYGFIDSLDFKFDDDVMWDTEDGYQLPMVVDITISFKMMYLVDGSGAPLTNLPHFKQGTTFTLPDNKFLSIYNPVSGSN